MTLRGYLKAQACNNAFANHRLLGACRRLTPGELAARRAGFFPSIVHTLNHILTVDRFYVSALENACIGPAAFEPEIPHRDFAALERAQRAVDLRLIATCDGAPERVVTLIRAAGPRRERADRVLLHLFQHQIHHRGQVHAMLSDTRVPPPQLDEFFLAEDEALRAADLAALGLSEATIRGDGACLGKPGGAG